MLPDPWAGTGSGAGPVRAARRGRRAGLHPRGEVSAGRAAAGAAGAGRHRPAGLRPHGLRRLRTVLRAGAHAGHARVPALLREPRAEGATRIGTQALARCWAWTRPPKLRRSAASSASWPQPARPRTCRWRSPATTPRPAPPSLGSCISTGTPGRISARGRAEDARGEAEVPRPGHRGNLGHRRCPGPAASRNGQPSSSLASQIRDLLPQLRDLASEAKVTLCFDRGGWSPDLFADIIDARFDLLTYRKNDSGKTPRPCPCGVRHGQLDRRRRPPARLRPRPVRRAADHRQGQAQGPRAEPAADHPPQARPWRR